MINFLIPREEKVRRKKTLIYVLLLSNVCLLILMALLGWSHFKYVQTAKARDYQNQQLAKDRIALANAIHKKNKNINEESKRSGLQIIEDGFLRLSYERVDVRTLLQLLANVGKINLLISEKVQGKMDLSLEHVTWQEAFENIMHLYNLAKVVRGDVWLVLPVEQKNQLEEISLHNFYLENRKAADVAEILKKKENNILSSRAIIIADPNKNGLIVKEVASRMTDVAQIIQELDNMPRQVLITARIVSVDENYIKDLGTRLGVAVAATGTDTTQINSAQGHLFVSIAHLDDLHTLDLELFALESKGHGKIIAKPRLITVDKQSAYIQSGEEIPYEEKTDSGATNITFKKAVLSLKVTPEMTASERITLKLIVNQDKVSAFQVKGVPGIDTQQLETQVIVNDGQTVVLGGIYEENNQEQVEKIPVISQIPLLGKLFTHYKMSKNRKELLVFITPKIIE